MKNWLFVTLLVLLFIVGAAAGWWCRLPSVAKEAGINTENYRSAQRTPNRGASHRYDGKASSDARYAEHVELLCNSELSSDEREALIADVKGREIPALLEQFRSKVGLGGMSYDDSIVFENLLEHWFVASPTKALRWLANMGDEQGRLKYSRDLIGSASEGDLDQAVEWAKEYLKSDNGSISIPYEFVDVATKVSEAKLLQVLQLGAYNGGGTGGSSTTYPKGFDFKSVLDGLADHLVNNEDVRLYQTVPSDLLETWAERDPQAAYDWFLEGKKLSFNEKIGDYIEGYAKSATAEELGVFTGQIFDRENPSYEALSEALKQKPSADLLTSFMGNVDASVSNEVHYVGLLNQIQGYSGGSSKMYLEILKQIPAERRLGLLNDKDLKLYRTKVDVHGEIRGVLINLGHSIESVDREFLLEK